LREEDDILPQREPLDLACFEGPGAVELVRRNIGMLNANPITVFEAQGAVEQRSDGHSASGLLGALAVGPGVVRIAGAALRGSLGDVKTSRSHETTRGTN